MRSATNNRTAAIIRLIAIYLLADGGYSTRAEPVVLTGECGMGKTHLGTGLGVVACPKVRVNAGVLQKTVAARCGLYLYGEPFGLDMEMAQIARKRLAEVRITHSEFKVRL